MRQETIEVEAESLPEAMSRLQARVPPGLFLLSRVIRSDGAPTKIRAVGTTVEQAFATVQASLPKDASIVEQKVLHSPTTRTYTFEAETEQDAKRRADSYVSRTTKLLQLALAVPGKKGLLGMGRRANQFQAEVLEMAEVEVTSKLPARVRGVVSDQVTNWGELLSAVRAFGDPLLNESLFRQYPHQSLYVGFHMKQEASYFEHLPFTPVTPALVVTAQRYIEEPRVPMLVAMSAVSKLDPNRYTLQADGQLARASNPMLDVCITQVAGCLAHYGPVDTLDQARMRRLAYEAIQHYAQLPLVEYCFTLPYFEAVIRSRSFSPREAQISVLMGVEGLLLELYEEFRDGHRIQDRTLEEKVRSFWTA